LGEVVELIRGISFPSSEKAFSSGEGLVACLRTANVQRQVEWEDLWYVPTRYVKQPKQFAARNDILMSTANSLNLVGKVAQVQDVPSPTTLGAFISALRPSGDINPRYAFYQLCEAEFQNAIRETASTTTNISNISTTRVLELRFSLAPIPEQERIVAEIESLFTDLDAAVAALKRVQSNLKRYRASMLKAACEGRLVPTEAELARKEGRPYETGEQLLKRILQERRAKWEADQLAKMHAAGKPPKNDDWKNKYKEPDPPDRTRLRELPDGWTWTSLSELKLYSIYGPRFSNEYSATGTVILRTTDISESGKVDISAAPRIELAAEDLAAYKLERGDVVFTRTGATVGKVAVFDDEITAIPGAYLIHFRLAAPPQTSWYVYEFFKSTVGQKALVKGAAGVGRPNLNAPTIESVPVPLPPFAEQLRINEHIAEVLSVIDKDHEQLNSALNKADRLRQAILKRAFEGKLVPQDPNDEPASALLERIRAERAMSSNSKPTLRRRALKRRAAEANG
jgi:type I restriction enzyme S subunit